MKTLCFSLLVAATMVSALVGCGGSGSQAVDRSLPEVKKGAKIRLAQSAYVTFPAYYDPGFEFGSSCPVGEVEEVRGNWVRMKFSPNKTGVVLKASDASIWVNFDTVNSFYVAK